MSYDNNPSDPDRSADAPSDARSPFGGERRAQESAAQRSAGSADRGDDITGPIPPVPDARPVPSAGPDQTRSFQMPHRGQQGPAPMGGPQPYGAPAQGPWADPTGQGAPYAAAQSGPFGPANGASGNNASGGSTTATRRRRGAPWIAVPIAAVLAAGLASGTTYALSDNQAGGSSTTTTKVVQANPADYKDGTGVNWAGTAQKVTDSVVSITVGSSSTGGGEGSGVVLDTKGNIVTNNHVVAAGGSSNPSITVTLTNNLTYKATVVGTDPATDLAVIRLEKPPADLKPITMGDDATLQVGQPVMAIGNPLGLSSTVTTGIVSALNRPVTAGSSSGDSSSTTNAVQTSAPINPGNSGGALVNASGQLIGINSSIASVGGSSGSSQSGNIGIGFAIPVSVVKSITSQLISKGSVVHAQLGVQASTGSVQIGDATETAAEIKEVVSGSAADKAGLKVGDAIVEADGRPIVSSEALVGYVRAKTVGEKVQLTVVRDGKRTQISVSLGKAS